MREWLEPNPCLLAEICLFPNAGNLPARTSRRGRIADGGPRPTDPVEAFAFVGSRYASRTTERMIEALREAGYDDLGILALTIAVADANNWARLHRLAGLPAELGYAGWADPAQAAAVVGLGRPAGGMKSKTY